MPRSVIRAGDVFDPWVGFVMQVALRGLRVVEYDRRLAGLTPCEHWGSVPLFDEQAARGLSDEEVRRRWPRFEGPCPGCGQRVILYASHMHYIAGDW